MFIEKIQSTEMLNNIASKYSNAVIEENIVKKYTSTDEEYNALKHGSGIYINHNPVIIGLEGNDVLDYLHRVSTNSVKDLQEGNIINTLFLNEKGRFIDRTVLLRLDNKFLIIGQNSLDWLLNWINKYIITEDIQTYAVSNYVSIMITGPQSDSFLTVILGDELKNINGNNYLRSYIDGFDFIIYSNSEKENIKHYKLLIEKEKLNPFVEYLLNSKSVFDVHLIGEDAYNLYRIKKGIPDKNETNHYYNPHEVGLINEISFNKGCYIGQEVIARLDTYDKVQRRMFKFSCPHKITTNDNLKLFDQNNEEIGDVTSFIYSEKENKTIGLALVRIKSLNEESKFHVLLENKKVFIEDLVVV